MSPIVLSIVAFIQSAIKVAPHAVELFKTIRKHIATLFQRGVITKKQQDELFAWVDGVLAAAQSGETPPAWQVEPDPETPAKSSEP